MDRSIRFAAIALALVAVIALGTVAWAQPGPGGQPGGQPGRQGGPPGGMFGGPGMGGMFGMIQSPFSLLNFDSIGKEIELTDDQKAKIKEINEKAQADMRKVFESMRDVEPQDREKAMAGIREKMDAQRKETNKAIQDVLLDHQVKRLKEIYVQARGEQSLRDPDIQNTLGLSQDQKAKIRSVLEILTDDQKSAFEKLKGEKFDLSTLRMAGPGGFGPGGPGGPGGDRRRPAGRDEAPKQQ